jgi:outer membrane protein assembly factor BamB
MSTKLKALALAGTILAAPIFANAAAAASIIGLVDGKSLVSIDPATKKVTGKADIKGATNVVGIDVRPADGMLYAVTGDGGIYTVDAKSGQATMKSKISEMMKGAITVVDFNPAADRLRVITAEGANLRINVDDGKTTVDGALKFKEGDAGAGKTPMVVAGAYTNSANPKPSATALYDIDMTTGTLVSQAPPNDGVLNTIGPLGIKLNGGIAFNIVNKGEENAAWLATGGMLYSVDLKTGKATSAGKLEGVSGKLTDIAWMD